jgi:hypothetical protein
MEIVADTPRLGEIAEQIVFGDCCQPAQVTDVLIEVPQDSLEFRGVDH